MFQLFFKLSFYFAAFSLAIKCLYIMHKRDIAYIWNCKKKTKNNHVHILYIF